MYRIVDIETDIRNVVEKYRLGHLLKAKIAVVYNSSSRSKAVARIWGLGKIFQIAYGLEPAYVIELLPAFTTLTCREKVRAIAHELAHIPSTGNGTTRPHNTAFWRDYKTYSALFKCSDFPSLQRGKA
ncbi:conserved hypothetical protein [Pyrobaculum islandicum DSM 4184]|uniref:Putative phage metallopeptidase domain-containing protein n=1 Tax=Pyrobaculum islandicum (strain DSM 4184 / JCM 9189 / GEO3) TaxID=384616 RepID=A1RVI5_PYRIL|nr:putative metallopeptidase [Pyrobaculum islandicum]ABL88967.1 conserved hypothetical protein [Pyrobaculum islandicum DSM 4184]